MCSCLVRCTRMHRHEVSVAVAAGLRAGAVIHQCRHAFGGGEIFRATLHEVYRDHPCNSMRFFPEEQFFSFEVKEKTDLSADLP